MEAVVWYLVWVVYCVLEGTRDGIMYNMRDYLKENDFNEHIIFTMQRSLVLVLLTYIYPPILIMAPFAFSFFHNGMYYSTRRFLNRQLYPKGWWSQSTSSSAKTTDLFTPTMRTIQFVISLLIIVVFTIKDKI